MKNSEIGTLDTSAARVELYRDRVAISHKKGTLAGKNVCISFGELEDAEFHEKNIMEGAYLLLRAEGMQELTYSVLSGPKMVNRGRIDLAKGETETAEKFCTDVRNALAQYRQGKPGGQYVVVCGGVNVDIGAYPFAPLVQRDSNPGRVETAPGGVGRNIAHNLSLLGADVCLLTALGEDTYAAQIERSCEELGIDLSRALRVHGGRTSTYVFVADERGDMALAVSDMAICEALTPDYFASQLDFLNGAAVIVADTNLSQESLRYLAEHCAPPLFIDPVSTAKAQKLTAILNRIHTLKPNRLEAEILSGVQIRDAESIRRAADTLLERGVKRVFLSFGESGLLAAEGEKRIAQKSFPAQMKNATGAGDALMAALVWSQLEGKTLAESACFGAAAASIAVESEKTINDALCVQSVLERASQKNETEREKGPDRCTP